MSDDPRTGAGPGATSAKVVAAALMSSALALATAASTKLQAGQQSPSKTLPPAAAQEFATGVRTIAPLPNGEWHIPNGDLAATRFSPLAQITPRNVAGLKVITTLSTGIPHGHEGAPLVVGNTMYVVTPYPNNLLAVDLTKAGGVLKWIYQPHPDPRAVGIACCDIVNRGAVFADGKIIYNTLDAHTVAVDCQQRQASLEDSGRKYRRRRNRHPGADGGEGQGHRRHSGGELGVRGWVLALAVSDGRELWRAYNTGPDEDVKIGPDFKPYYAKDQGKDLGVKSWPAEQWKLGGATVWGWFSYDPELNLVYYGSGNPGVWNPDLRPGDNKWSCSIIARNPDDGSARWAYQIIAHDAWDYDEIMENVLVDMSYGGQLRKLLIHPGRNGFVFVLDRAMGQLLSATKFEPVNWAEDFDLQTGRARENPEKRTKYGVVTRDICPSSTGAKEFVPSASRHVQGCSTFRHTTPAWTTKAWRQTTSQARPTSVPA